MKKIIFAFMALGLSLYANNSGKFKIDELVILPHPGKVLKFHAKEVGVTKDDMMRIRKEIKAVYAPKFQGKIREAFTIEQKVKRMVSKGKTPSELKDDLDKIAKLKREAIDYRIQALNKFREILGEEKWLKIVKYKMKPSESHKPCKR